MERTAAAQRKYTMLLREAEDEYERRYGANPSDVDDDRWIDALGSGCGDARALSVAEVEEGVRMSGLNYFDS